MNKNDSEPKELLNTLEITDKDILKQIKGRYQGKIFRKNIILFFLLFILISFTAGQLAILKESFFERFSVDSKIFGLETSFILSSMIAGFLPISSMLDESGTARVMNQRIGEVNFSGIWILVIFDFLLTWQAILSFESNNLDNKNIIQLLASLLAQKPLLAFCVAAVVSLATIFFTRGIVTIVKEISYLENDLNTVIVHKFDPHPSYRDAEQIRLNKEKEAAIEQLKVEKLKYEEELLSQKALYELEKIDYQKEFELRQENYENQIKDHELKYTNDVGKLELAIEAYKTHYNSINDLKKKFNQVKKPIIDLVSQGKNLFDKVSGLDESVKDLQFPNLQLKSDNENQFEVVEQPIYYYSSLSWQDLPLPSELSPISNTILSILEPELPEPKIEAYSPKEELAECLVLNFNEYDVIVYFRDEKYKQDGREWRDEEESIFKKMLNQKRINGIHILEYTDKEIVEDPQSILKEITDAINSKTENF